MYTKSKEKIELASELFRLIEARHQLERREAELKDFFKEEIKDGFLQAGEIMISLLTKTRTGLDRKAMDKELGEAFLKRFQTATVYTQMNVERVYMPNPVLKPQSDSLLSKESVKQ